MWSSAGEGKPAEIVSFANGIDSVDEYSFEEEQELFEFMGPDRHNPL